MEKIKEQMKEKGRARVGHWLITYNPKPVPIRNNDYDMEHDDYDGENGLAFTVESIEDAVELMDQLRDQKCIDCKTICFAGWWCEDCGAYTCKGVNEGEDWLCKQCASKVK